MQLELASIVQGLLIAGIPALFGVLWKISKTLEGVRVEIRNQGTRLDAIETRHTQRLNEHDLKLDSVGERLARAETKLKTPTGPIGK